MNPSDLSTNFLDLSGKTIIVTGASSGLGAGISKTVSKLGARVILVARNIERLETVRSSLIGNEHIVEPLNLNQVEAIPSWMVDLSARYGKINGVVHSAGILPTKPLRLFEPQDWDNAMRINVTAAAFLAKAFRQRNVNSEGGSIVFLSSVMGLSGQPGQVLYSATKGALIAMTRSLSLELARESIRVNCVAPAVVDGGMTNELRASLPADKFNLIVSQHPLGIGTVEDVGGAVAYLLSDYARWITGSTLVIDGGYTAQ